MGATSIEWTRGEDGSDGHTVNPIRARRRDGKGKFGHYCEKVSPGCTFCYASRFQPRVGLPQFSGTHGRRLLEEVEPYLDASKLREVLSRKKPTTYFWSDMTDLFGHWVPNEWIATCFGVMAATPWHTHQVLTKRAERLALLGATLGLETFGEAVARAAEYHAGIVWDSRGSERHLYPANTGDISRRRIWPGWPLPNVWIGVSVEDQQRADERIPFLLRTPAAVRFLSCEPLLGPVDLSRWIGYGSETMGLLEDPPIEGRISWAICGGESGAAGKARPMHREWAESLRDQCADAGVPFFMKQAGHWIDGDHSGFGTVQAWRFKDGSWWVPPLIGPMAFERPEGATAFHLTSAKGGNPLEWPEPLRVRQMPAVPRG